MLRVIFLRGKHGWSRDDISASLSLLLDFQVVYVSLLHLGLHRIVIANEALVGLARVAQALGGSGGLDLFCAARGLHLRAVVLTASEISRRSVARRSFSR